MMEKSTTTRELFSRIRAVLKTKVKPPDIFDLVGLPTEFTE